MTFLIDFGIKSTLALAAAFVIAVTLRKGSAALRYALWSCALIALLVLPVASWIGPRWNIDRSAWRRATSSTPMTTAETPSAAVVVEGEGPRSREFPTMLWIAGVVAMLARMGAGHWRVRMLFGNAERIRDPRWLDLARETAARVGMRRPVLLRRGAATDVPLSYGLIRATVLLPGESEHWQEDRRRIVLAHEMIHARRLDAVWGLLAQCALAVNWFNPLAWLAIRQFRKEQERSCDDAVVLSGTASTLYAAHLVDLARSIAIPEPALGMAERFDLEGRVHALLDTSRRRKEVSGKLCAAIFCAALMLIVPLAAVRAQTAGTPDSPEPQATPATALKGTVYDPSGAVIPGAMISLKSLSSEEVGTADENGSYKMQAIPSGEYVVKVKAPGFATYQKTMLIEAAAPATMNVHLAIGDVEERVVITAKRPEGAAPDTAPSARVRVGGMVQAMNLIRKVNPAYPPDARAEGVEGTVALRAIVSKNGSLLSIVPVKTSVDPRLVSAAVAAVSVWQYQPTLLNGEPVEVITTIDVTFRLN